MAESVCGQCGDTEMRAGGMRDGWRAMVAADGVGRLGMAGVRGSVSVVTGMRGGRMVVSAVGCGDGGRRRRAVTRQITDGEDLEAGAGERNPATLLAPIGRRPTGIASYRALRLFRRR